MNDRPEILTALKTLHGIFSQPVASTFAIMFPPGQLAVYDDEAEFNSHLREMRKAAFVDSHRLEEARKTLLASGFNVPDSWLTVNPIMEPQFRHEASGFMGLGFLVEDRKAIAAVCREIHAAILRLENSPQPADVSPKEADTDSLIESLATKIRGKGFAILSYLWKEHKNGREAVSYEELQDEVWGMDKALSNATINKAINRLNVQLVNLNQPLTVVRINSHASLERLDKQGDK